jgi:DNA-binding GntR family transcriptional regulator
MDMDNISPLRPAGPHRQLSERVADHVRESIMVGDLREGYVRTERLAEALGVSPTPVREALMILQAEGTVRWEPRKGFRIIPLSQKDITDIYQVQATIAGELAARAASLLSGAEIIRLHEYQDQLNAAFEMGQFHDVDKLNHEVHRRINLVSNSTKLTHLLTQTVRYVPLGFFEQIDGWADASAHDHKPIIDALERRSRSAARKAMEHHIKHIGSLLLDHLRDSGRID